MGKTVDASEILYRMGKYGEIDAGKERNEMFKHFMHLLTKVIEVLPNTSLTVSPVDNDIFKNQYKMIDAISLKTGKTRSDEPYSKWIGMIMEIKKLEINKPSEFKYIKDSNGNLCDGSTPTTYVTDYYISENKNDLIVQTNNTIFKFQKV